MNPDSTNNSAAETAAATPATEATPKRTPNEARCINATLSTGPKTEAGKAASKMSATKHGLCARTILGSAAELQQHREYSEALREDLEPVGALEVTLVQNIADAQFQLDRTRAMEQNLFFETALKYTDEADETRDFDADYDQGQAFTFEAKSKQLDLLARYGNRFHRQIIQNQNAFYKARDERRKEEARQAVIEKQRRAESMANWRQESDEASYKRMQERAEAKANQKSSFVRQNGNDTPDPTTQKPRKSVAETMAAIDRINAEFQKQGMLR